MNRAPRRTAPAVVVALALLLAFAPAAGAYTVTTLTGFSQPRAAAISPDGATAYVTNSGGGGPYSVGIVDLAAGTARQTAIDLGYRRPHGVAFAPNGARAHVTADDSRLLAIDTATEAPVGTGIHTAGDATNTNPAGVVITADGTRAYTANFGTDGVGVIDLVAGTARQLSVGRSPIAVAVHASGTDVLVVDPNNSQAWVAETATASQSQMVIGSFNTPQAVALSPDGSTAYISNQGSNTIAVVDVAQRTVTQTLPLPAGGGPDGLAVSPSGRWLFVALVLREEISVIDTATGDLVATIATTDHSPGDLAISPDGARLVSANFNSNSVSVVQIAPLAPTALTATASDTAATVSFTAPTANGTPITGYEYSLNGGAWTAATANASPLAIGGLTPGTAYAIRVRAVDARGPGLASAAVSVTTQSPAAAPRTAAFRARTPATTRTRAGATRLRTTVTTPGAGTITQRATTTGPGRAKAVTRCQTRLRVKAAGDHVVSCTLNAKAQAALKRGRLVLRVATTFTATGAKTGETATARVVVPRRR